MSQNQPPSNGESNLVVHISKDYFCTGCGFSWVAADNVTAHYCKGIGQPERWKDLNIRIEDGTPLPEQTKDSDEVRIVSATGGAKGQKSVRVHAIPRESLWELGRVYAFGEDKYDDYNFRKGYKWSLSYDSLIRHATAFWDGEDTDSESNLHHMAHAVWHGICLLFFSLRGRGEDDRPND